jgi:hypothetical protein
MGKDLSGLGGNEQAWGGTDRKGRIGWDVIGTEGSLPDDTGVDQTGTEINGFVFIP